MTEPKFLPQVKQINTLPINQTCRRLLENLKVPLDPRELFPSNP